MKSTNVLFSGLTLLGLTFLIVYFGGQLLIDVNDGKLEINGSSQSSTLINKEGCQPKQESNRLCDSK